MRARRNFYEFWERHDKAPIGALRGTFNEDFDAFPLFSFFIIYETDNYQLFTMANPMSDVKREPFPATSRQWAEEVGGIETDFTAMQFSDKILLTISQGGKLAHWVTIRCGTLSKLT